MTALGLGFYAPESNEVYRIIEPVTGELATLVGPIGIRATPEGFGDHDLADLKKTVQLTIQNHLVDMLLRRGTYHDEVLPRYFREWKCVVSTPENIRAQVYRAHPWEPYNRLRWGVQHEMLQSRCVVLPKTNGVLAEIEYQCRPMELRNDYYSIEPKIRIHMSEEIDIYWSSE